MRTIIVLLAFVLGVFAQQPLTFTVDQSVASGPWIHFWERSFGSCHATTALRDDYRQQLLKAQRDLGVQRVRFHGLFDDDMSVVLPDGQGGVVYSWFNIDQIYDWLVANGMAPIIELSFMPELLASSDATIFHYKGNISPPKNMSQWEDLISNFVAHLLDRYGKEVYKWYFEVWNEPNCGFFNGTQEQYFELLAATSAAIKRVDPKLKVGGPATCGSKWIPDTLAFIQQNNVSLDVITTHLYPTDFYPTLKRNTLSQVISGVRAIVPPNMELLYTETNDGLYEQIGFPPEHDELFASSFVVFNMIDVHGMNNGTAPYADVLSWWTFTDIFEEGGQDSTPFHGGYGVQTIYGIAKPSYRAFELMHQTGDHRIPVQEIYDTVGIVATYNSSHLIIMAYNHQLPRTPIQAYNISITVDGSTVFPGSSVVARRIDDTHCNTKQVWVDMGSPMYPTKKDLDHLHKASKLIDEQIPVVAGKSITINTQILPQAVIQFVLPRF